jgi:hypothetical protein
VGVAVKTVAVKLAVEAEEEQDSDDERSGEEGEFREVAPPQLAYPHGDGSGDFDSATEQAGGARGFKRKAAAKRPEAAAEPPHGEEWRDHRVRSEQAALQP